MPPLAPPRPARAPAPERYVDAESAWSPAGYAALADRPALLGLALLAWSAAGLAVALVLARRGHEAGPWAVLGLILGPFLLGLAVQAVHHRRDEHAPIEVAPGRRGTGELTVVVALLAEPGHAADAAPIMRWLAHELGEVVLVSPITVEAALHDRDDAVAAGARRLSQAALFLPDVAPRLVLVPGSGADATARFAADAGAAVLVVVGDQRARAVRACARRLRGRTIVAAPRHDDRGHDDRGRRR